VEHYIIALQGPAREQHCHVLFHTIAQRVQDGRYHAYQANIVQLLEYRLAIAYRDITAMLLIQTSIMTAQQDTTALLDPLSQQYVLKAPIEQPSEAH